MNLLKTALLAAATLAATAISAQTPADYPANYAREPRFKALIYYSTEAEEAHVQFAEQSVEFFHKLSYGEGFLYDMTTDLTGYTYDQYAAYDMVIMLNAIPMDAPSRQAFEQYMENGGGWMGFHGAGYNDASTGWPWYVNFLGGTVFYCNNWPPQPALLQLDTATHDITKNLPDEFVAPASEWYMWKPGPQENPDVDVLLSISPKNYPFGIKDIIYHGDFPVVWTNRNYRMVYLNMGHGDEEYQDATQKLLFVNAFRWIASRSPKGDPFAK